MLYHKVGLPQESELVVCTVTKIHSHSVFVKLDSYDNLSAMLHISEVSPGRIRNIRDYVKENKTIYCKVLSVNPEKGHIDVSLRRVSEGQRIAIASKLKQELKAEKIIEHFCKENKLDLQKTYAKIYKSINKEYEFLNEAFDDFIQEKYDFKSSGLTDAQHKKLIELIRERVKPPLVEIVGKFKIISFAGDGVIQIKETLNEASKVDEENMKISYGGGGFYQIRIVTGDFKSAEKILQDVEKITKKKFEGKKDFIYEFTRSEGKQLS